MPHTRRSMLAGVGLVAVAALLQAACTTHPDVHHQQDAGVDLGRYETFGFLDPTRSGTAGYAALTTVQARRAVREEMERRGYRFDEKEADLRVNLVLSVANRQEVRSMPTGRAFGPWGYRAGSIETVDYRQGTLVIDLVDVERHALVWRGVAEGRVERKAMDDPGATVEGAVREIFVRLPARATQSATQAAAANP